MPFPSPPPVAPKKRLSSLTLFVLCFLGSCGVVAAILFLEISTFTRSNNGFQASTYLLILFPLLFGLLGIVVACCYKRFLHALAIVFGLLPVALVALLVYTVTGKDTDYQQMPSEQQEAEIQARQEAVARQEAIIRSHPYTGRDSIEPYYTAEQMPSLTGKPEYHPKRSESYIELAQLLSRRARPGLNLLEQHPDTIPVSFTVGPYGGIYQERIQYAEIPEAYARTRANEAVLRAVRGLTRLYPGRIKGQPVPVRIVVAVPMPASP